MSEQEARRTVAEAQREAEEAARTGEKARQEFEAIEQRQRAGLPAVPRGRPPEAVKHVKIQPEKLERRQTFSEFFRRRQGRQTMLRERRGERARPVRQAPHVSSSRGAPLYTKRNPLESSGRISTELAPEKQERLAKVREYIRAFQNRKELSQLEKVWRRTRSRYSHDPELRP